MTLHADLKITNMTNKTISALIICGLLCLTWVSPLNAQIDQTKQEKKTSEIKAKIKRLGTGEQVNVKVKLYSGSSYQGYVSQSNEGDFAVVDRSGKAETIKYSDVDTITGKNFLSGHKLAIGVTIGVIGTAAIIFAIFKATGKRL